MLSRNKHLFLVALAIALSCSQGVQSTSNIAFAEDSKAKKSESKEDKLKSYFQKWFTKFFGTLYYAKDVSEIKPFYSNAFMRGYDKIPEDRRREVLDKMKLEYFAKPKIASIRMHPSGFSCDVTIKGFRSVYKKVGYGIGIYRMIKEGNVWKIDSAVQKGQAIVH